MANRNWKSLGDRSKRDYLKWGKQQGWSRQRLIGYYRRGGSMKAARRHAKTPEHPGEAERAPQKFREYLASNRRIAIARRRTPIRVMTDQGVFWVRGLKKYDRTRVAIHWQRVGAAQRLDSNAPLRPYRKSYVGGYSGVEISFSLNDPDDDNSYELLESDKGGPIPKIKLADNLDPINTAVQQNQPVHFEFIYGG